MDQPVPTIATEPPKTNWLLFLLVGIIILGIGIAIGQFLEIKLHPRPTPYLAPLLIPSPSSDPTANWKTYTNSKYGYLLQYPTSVTIGDPNDPANKIYTRFTIGRDQLTIQHFDNPLKLNVRDFYNKLFAESETEAKKNNYPSPQKPIQTQVITINDINVYQITTSTGERNALNTYITKDNVVIDISFDKEDSGNANLSIDNLEHARLFNQILSTFKFTKTNGSEANVPNIIQQLIPQVKWGPQQPISKYPLLSFGVSVLVSQRMGTIINPDVAGNPYDISDLLHDKSKLTELGWSKTPPKGASGPLTRITDYHKTINGVDKILRFVIENTDFSSSANPSDLGTKVKCPCVNKITVFQQQ